MLPTKPFHSMENLYSGEDLEDGEVALCFLSSIVAGRVTPEEYEDVAYYTLLCIDNVIETMQYPFKHTELTAKSRRSVGVGITNLAHYLASNFATYDSDYGKRLIHEHSEMHYFNLLKGSLRLAKEKGNAEWMDKTKWGEGWLPIDTYSKAVDTITNFELKCDWETLRKEVIEQGGIRNSVLMAVAPNESSSLLSDTTNSLYPIRDLKLFKQSQKGNVLFIAPDADKLKGMYQSAWDINSPHIADLYSIATKFADQGISCDSWVNLTEGVSSDSVTRDHVKYILKCAKQGVKSLYYLNSRTKQSGTIAEEFGELKDIGCESCDV